MRIAYEWDFEVIDKYGDIVDHLVADTLEDLLTYGVAHLDSSEHIELALVRTEWAPFNADESIFGMDETVADRQWAYVSNGKLQTEFNYPHGYSVPKRKIAEFNKNKDLINQKTSKGTD